MDLPTELFDGREIIEFHLPNMVGFMETRDDEGNAVDASPRFSVGNRIDWKLIQIEAFAKFGILIGENPRAKSFSHLLKAMAVNDKQKHSDLMPMQERLDDLIDMYEARIALDLGVNVPRKGLSKLAGVSEKAVINAALNGELSCTEKSKKEYTNSTALAWLKSPKRRQKYFETLSFPEAGKDESVKSVVALDHANDLIKFTRAIDFIRENEQIVIDKVPVNELL